MANYTIDDIEILRRKSGITYEEAVNLLEYHNGSLTRSLIDLERNGRLREDGPQTRAAAGGEQTGLKKLFNTLYHIRLMVKNNGLIVANLSVLFMIATVMVAPHLAVIGLILSLVFGYRISIDRNNPAFADDTFDSMVETARSNVQSTVQNFSRSFSEEEKTQPEETERPRSASAASGTRPVNVQFPGGTQVDIRADDDGYHEADIG
ncbi:MAG: DUF4342 domain-containing protein [Clostridiales bacterium]|nr:DUF4342 domain-containing protein [Clostridiales bacterium]